METTNRVRKGSFSWLDLWTQPLQGTSPEAHTTGTGGGAVGGSIIDQSVARTYIQMKHYLLSYPLSPPALTVLPSKRSK